MSPDIPQDPDIKKKVRIIWPIKPDARPFFANQFQIGTIGPDVVIDIGSSLVMGPGNRTHEEFVKEAGTQYVDVGARLVLSVVGLMTLRDLLNQHIKRMGIEVSVAKSEKTDDGAK